MSRFGIFRKNIGIDLGTSNVLVYLDKRGIVVNEPSIVALNNKTNQVVAVGNEARDMLGRTPSHITVARPLVNGVIADFEVTQEILRHLLRRVSKDSIFVNYRRAVVGVPSNLTEVERKSVEDAVIGAGVFQALLIEEPLAAALGARLPINEPTANMVVDIGGGTTEVAIISMGGIVTAKSLKIAGDKFNDDIIRFVRDEFKIAIGEPTAEEVKIAVGSVLPVEERLEIAVRGRDLTTGLPREILVKDPHVRAAIGKSFKVIVDAIREVIESAPPELAGDILKRGIYLCGGGSLLRGVAEYISKDLMVMATVVDDPLTCVVRGTGVAIEHFAKYRPVLQDPSEPRTIRL